MDILAAFFLIGLTLSGVRMLVRHLWISLNRFNLTETFFSQTSGVDHVNVLSPISNKLRRSAAIRTTSARESRKTLELPAQEIGTMVTKYPAAEMA